MDDSALFMEWAMGAHQHPVAVVDGECGETAFPSLQALCDVSHAALAFREMIMGAHAASSGSSGETTDASGGGGNFSSPPAMVHPVWPLSPNTGSNPPVMSWNFGAIACSALPAGDGAPPLNSVRAGIPEVVYGARPARSTGTVKGPDHTMAERKRRERINQLFIQLSTLIPGLKKTDKATILSGATRHVKELQQKIRALEIEAPTGRNSRSLETVVLVKNGSPLPAASGAPEIEVQFSEKTVMVRVLCDDAKRVVVRVMSELEEGLPFRITNANVMPFKARTLIITITAKRDEGFTVTVEEIVASLRTALEQQISSCTPSKVK
ncbi:hypothetical protein ACQJBY_040122 [Aegilops geniculata]